MKDISRRDFFRFMGTAALGAAAVQIGGVGSVLAQAPVVGSADVTKKAASGSRAKVYFTKHIDAKHLLKLYTTIMVKVDIQLLKLKMVLLKILTA